ncbi:MAG: hypothetical protein ACJ71D_06205 [Nitrososphaera sp.]
MKRRSLVIVAGIVAAAIIIGGGGTYLYLTQFAPQTVMQTNLIQ